MAAVEEQVAEKEVTEQKSADGSDANNSSDVAKTDTDKSEKESADKDAQNITKLEEDIIRQVEYYFGDANLRRDKFLREQIGNDEEGWVPFLTLLTFKRLAALSTDVEAIVNALMKSDEGIIEISEDRTKIRRHPENPIPEYNEEHRKEIASRSAYVKGFPLDSEMSDLIEFFSPFEKVENIVMRKYLDRPSKTYKFKGSVFVTFVKKEQCEKFLSKEKIQYREKDLIKKWQEDYITEKKNEEKHPRKKSKQKKEEENTISLPKGAILHFENCGESTRREDIRSGLEKLAADVGTEIAFIEYRQGEPSGYVRLNEENSAKPLLDKLEDKKLKINNDVELTLRTLTEEEESEFLKKAIGQMKSRRMHQNKNKGNRKRKTSDQADSEPAVKQKN